MPDERDIMPKVTCEMYPALVGTFGFIDDGKWKIQRSLPELQEKYWNGWLHNHCIYNVYVFSAVGDIIYDVQGTADN